MKFAMQPDSRFGAWARCYRAVSIGCLVGLLVLAGGASAAPPHKDPPHKDLPPGLKKKAQRGESLPPGWQRKLAPGQVLEESIYERRVVVRPRDRDGIITVSIDGELIRLVENTREIIEILSH